MKIEGFMGLKLIIDEEVKDRFPDLNVLLMELESLKVLEYSEELEKFKSEIYGKLRKKYRLESLKDDPLVRTYRNFFWRIGIDPTKIRPAAEALLRRILSGKGLPRINTLVDSYNLASAESGIALAAFDSEKIDGDMIMRFANEGEEFLGIGMRKPKILRGGEIVVADSRRLIAIYPYRDAEYSKVTLKTENIYLMVCGVPGIGIEVLKNAGKLAADYILRFCGGKLFNEF
ncbi:MAG TPA: hypothetical protein ENF33_00015 [Nitrososphaeria archaeon]|nr:hypothetical protein [Nitrososphaeria archaeon]